MKVTIDTDEYFRRVKQAMLHKFVDGKMEPGAPDYEFVSGLVNLTVALVSTSDEDTIKENIIKSSIDGIMFQDNHDDDTDSIMAALNRTGSK